MFSTIQPSPTGRLDTIHHLASSRALRPPPMLQLQRLLLITATLLLSANLHLVRPVRADTTTQLYYSASVASPGAPSLAYAYTTMVAFRGLIYASGAWS